MLLRLDFSGDMPIYQQIRNQVVTAIASGQLKPGEKLPTIRALAEECGIRGIHHHRTPGRRYGAAPECRGGTGDPRRTAAADLRAAAGGDGER